MRNLLKDKKGSILHVFIFAIVLVAVIAGAFVFILISVYFSNTWNTVTNTLTGIETVHPSVNISAASETTFGSYNTSLKSLNWITAFLILGSIIGILVFAFFVRVHPMFFIIYIILLIIIVIISMFISNAYESVVLNSPQFAGDFAKYTASDYIMRNLPYVITVIGMMGAVIMAFSYFKREEDPYGVYY